MTTIPQIDLRMWVKRRHKNLYSMYEASIRDGADEDVVLEYWNVLCEFRDHYRHVIEETREFDSKEDETRLIELLNSSSIINNNN